MYIHNYNINYIDIKRYKELIRKTYNAIEQFINISVSLIKIRNFIILKDKNN